MITNLIIHLYQLIIYSAPHFLCLHFPPEEEEEEDDGGSNNLPLQHSVVNDDAAAVVSAPIADGEDPPFHTEAFHP